MKSISSQALAALGALALAGPAHAIQPTSDPPHATLQPVAQQQIQGQVKSIDHHAKTFTLRESDKTFQVTGSSSLYKNNDLTSNFDSIHLGDQVVATYSGSPDAKKVEVQTLKATSGGVGPPGE